MRGAQKGNVHWIMPLKLPCFFKWDRFQLF